MVLEYAFFVSIFLLALWEDKVKQEILGCVSVNFF